MAARKRRSSKAEFARRGGALVESKVRPERRRPWLGWLCVVVTGSGVACSRAARWRGPAWSAVARRDTHRAGGCSAPGGARLPCRCLQRWGPMGWDVLRSLSVRTAGVGPKSQVKLVSPNACGIDAYAHARSRTHKNVEKISLCHGP
jgi:hypothetical protein